MRELANIGYRWRKKPGHPNLIPILQELTSFADIDRTESPLNFIACPSQHIAKSQLRTLPMTNASADVYSAFSCVGLIQYQVLLLEKVVDVRILPQNS